MNARARRRIDRLARWTTKSWRDDRPGQPLVATVQAAESPAASPSSGGELRLLVLIGVGIALVVGVAWLVGGLR